MKFYARSPSIRSETFDELEESAKYAKDDPSMKPVSLSIALLAVIVAIISLLGHRKHMEEILVQNMITDGWAYYQAKSSRGHESEMFADLVSISSMESNADKIFLQNKYKNEERRYKKEKNELFIKARALEVKNDKLKTQADLLDTSEGLLEASLVITSISLLAGSKNYWYAGLVISTIGAIIAIAGFIDPVDAFIETVSRYMLGFV